jgi:hypothetical protein
MNHKPHTDPPSHTRTRAHTHTHTHAHTHTQLCMYSRSQYLHIHIAHTCTHCSYTYCNCTTALTNIHPLNTYMSTQTQTHTHPNTHTFTHTQVQSWQHPLMSSVVAAMVVACACAPSLAFAAACFMIAAYMMYLKVGGHVRGVARIIRRVCVWAEGYTYIGCTYRGRGGCVQGVGSLWYG